jgi:tryptophan-rich sensory protein
MFRPVWILLVAELLLLQTSIDTAWYDSLQKPSYQPPSYAFGLAWGMLYPLLAYTYYLLVQSGSESELALFETQLVLNLAWSFVFFRQKNLYLSTMMLLLMIILNLLFYRTFSKPWYLVYIAWLCFAFLLNLAILRLN